MFESAIVIAIVALAAWFVMRRLAGQVWGGRGGQGCGHPGCPNSGSCGGRRHHG